ncbi:exodeoxyribonuclease III [Aquirufa regiilacus]|uniref:Exodeoxyribonuclease III n=1 Tax=Aquirufa regiilacus TaxID=3024868 RepID=A0ABU3TSJ8_9BACT|nr:exodeoxyribonuclease III [Aquirufa sp. LEOWEIH-7C]MDU0808850.1 exodeoxyribonuclease III [Aquirufa sp. LEOWEIH-7C]
MLKIISYNVNGIRAAIQKGFVQWLADQQADVICIQELKAEFDQVDTNEIEQLGYSVHWHSAQKKGYSGVAVFTKLQPKHTEIGCGIEKYDFEGRVIRLDFDNFSVMSVYMPSGSSGDERQAFKMEWLTDFQDYIQALRQEIPNLIISGDYNICHRAIDIHNPKGNANSSGFLPEEREWMESFVQNGFVDTFRHINPEQAHAYSWWSYRAGARGKNLGWRIDYHMASETLKDRIANAYILPDAMHSDHCPIVLELNPA